MCEMERICTNFLFGYLELVHGAKLCAQCGIKKKKLYYLTRPKMAFYSSKNGERYKNARNTIQLAFIFIVLRKCSANTKRITEHAQVTTNTPRYLMKQRKSQNDLSDERLRKDHMPFPGNSLGSFPTKGTDIKSATSHHQHELFIASKLDLYSTNGKLCSKFKRNYIKYISIIMMNASQYTHGQK